MSAASDSELEALRRPFRLGMVAVLAAVVAIGGIVAAFGANADRPAGIAERWMVALSDTTRDGVRDDALDRLDELTRGSDDGGYIVDELTGRENSMLFVSPPLARGDLLAADDGKPWFTTLQVGQAITAETDEDTVFVPVRFTPYEADDAIDAYVGLHDYGDADADAAADGGDAAGDEGWKVAGFFTVDVAPTYVGDPAFCAEGCPGFPIERPERAPIGFWFGAIALGLLITVGCSAAVRAAGGSAGSARKPATGVAS